MGLSVQFLKKKNPDKFSWLALSFKHFFYNQNSAQCEWAKKETKCCFSSASLKTKISKSWNQAKISLSTLYTAKKIFIENEFLMKRGSRGLTKKWKEAPF